MSGMNTATVSKSQRGGGKFLTKLLTIFHMPTARGRGKFLTKLLTIFHMPTARAHKVGYLKGEVHALTLAARSYCALAHCNRLMFLDL